MPLNYINPIYVNNSISEVETLNVTGVTNLGDEASDMIIIKAGIISVPNNININNNIFFINSLSNRIGINTTNPSQLFHVNGNSVISGSLAIGNNSPSYRLHISNISSQGVSSPFGIEDNGLLAYYANLGDKNLNNAILPNDKAIIYSGININEGNLFIGINSNFSQGSGIKFNHQGLNVYGNINIDNGLFYTDSVSNRIGINTVNPSALITINKTNASSITDYSADFQNSNSDINFGRFLFSQGSNMALAVSVIGSINENGRTEFQYINRTSGQISSTPLIIHNIGGTTISQLGVGRKADQSRLEIQSNEAAFAIDLVGRQSDNISIIRFRDNAGSVIGRLAMWNDSAIHFDNGVDSTFRILSSGQIQSAIPNNLSAGMFPGFLCRAWINFSGNTASNSIGATYVQSGTLVTVTLANHGALVGHIISVTISGGTAISGIYTVNTVSENTFTYIAGTSLTTSGNITLNRRMIRASGNIAYVSYIAVGDYIINFINPMPDVNYCTVFGGQFDVAGSGFAEAVAGLSRVSTPQTVMNVRVITGNTAFADVTQVSVAIFR